MRVAVFNKVQTKDGDEGPPARRFNNWHSKISRDSEGNFVRLDPAGEDGPRDEKEQEARPTSKIW